MQLAILLSSREIEVINISRAKHDGIIIHPGKELELLLKNVVDAEQLRPALMQVRADRTKRDQVGWRVSAETFEKIDSLAAALGEATNRTEVVRSVIFLRGRELELSESETGAKKTCGQCETCSVYTPRISPDRFTLAAISAPREGNVLAVSKLANAIIAYDCVVVTAWDSAAVGTAELRHIAQSHNYSWLESLYRPETSDGFIVFYKERRFRYATQISGEIPAVFFPLSIKDLTARKELIILAINSEETQEARIAEVTSRFKGSQIITVWGDDITPASDNIGVKKIDDSNVLKAEITYI